MSSTLAAPFEAPPYSVVELGPADVDRLQAFLERNPEYALAVEGHPPADDAAHEALHAQVPADWPQGRHWRLGVTDVQGDLVALLDIVTDLLAPGVWHVGLFLIATALHGTGAARALHRQMETWARAGGARWLRLGVVRGNARAERFWARQGYREVRTREGIAMGARVNVVRVMVKPLEGGSLDHYLGLVPRDRPDPDERS